ncbi:hypothetical protein ACFQH2_16715 [Natronoarchaeum sp. GCM10025703]|uniref:hypothetical protein n=1 Tax=unclassified Natronoarchaeum TaxID=2620183 RepID=UPI00360CD408
MVEKRVTDGVRIAQLLSSEIDGRVDGALGRLSVTNPDRAVSGTADGDRAYDIEWTEERVEDPDDSRRQHASGEGCRIAQAFAHDDRVRIELSAGQEVAADRAESEGLRVRPKAVHRPKTLVFVESGAETKRAAAVLDVVSAALAENDA